MPNTVMNMTLCALPPPQSVYHTLSLSILVYPRNLYAPLHTFRSNDKYHDQQYQYPLLHPIMAQPVFDEHPLQDYFRRSSAFHA